MTTLEELLAGKTLYSSIYNTDTLESLTFNADLTSFTWLELVGGSHSGGGTLILDDMSMRFTDDDITIPVVVTEILEDYILVTISGLFTRRLYFDGAKARAYFLG